jgi:hypothetical protein
MLPVEPISILILGPMQPAKGEQLAPEPYTEVLANLVSEIVAPIQIERALDREHFRVDDPSRRKANLIITDIFERIEHDDLVVIDLTDFRPNVIYELGLLHCLGIPHISVSRKRRELFYLQGSICIFQLDLSGGFDPTKRGHLELQRRIREFLEASAGNHDGRDLVKFAENRISEFFEKVPVVDLSVPTGLAAGYWLNAIRRFFDSGGYMTAPRRLTWDKPPHPAQADLEYDIEHFIAVIPPSLVADTPPGRTPDRALNDQDLLQDELTSLRLSLFNGILPTDGKRPFPAKFLARSTDGGAAKLAVVDIPTTLYALEKAPRILRIAGETLSGRRGSDIDPLRRRRVREMLRRFEMMMEFYIAKESNPWLKSRFHLVQLPELRAKLETLGYLPGPT